MEGRKIQLIAGITYSVSLPREWVKKNKLKEKSQVFFHEKEDGSLVILPSIVEAKKFNKLSLNIDNYLTSIDQILFTVYYMGIGDLTLTSRQDISRETKAQIKKTLHNISGAEIIYEDKQKIQINFLLDITKINVPQIFYRINLIIGSSISNILSDMNIEEISMNEEEIDRLYHLVAKIVMMSAKELSILDSSGIKSFPLVPSYLLIAKRLENIADNIYALAGYYKSNKIKLGNEQAILEFVKTELNRNIAFFLNKEEKVFKKIPHNELEKIKERILKLKDKSIANFTRDMVRFLVNTEEEIVNISFYEDLMKENLTV